MTAFSWTHRGPLPSPSLLPEFELAWRPPLFLASSPLGSLSKFLGTKFKIIQLCWSFPWCLATKRRFSVKASRTEKRPASMLPLGLSSWCSATYPKIAAAIVADGRRYLHSASTGSPGLARRGLWTGRRWSAPSPLISRCAARARELATWPNSEAALRPSWSLA